MKSLIVHPCEGQTEPKSNGTANGGLDGDDFLTRERALLGDDAAQFSSANDNSATVEDGDDDLLGDGGDYDGGQGGGEEISEFESSFPPMDSQNEVSYCRNRAKGPYLANFIRTASWSGWHDYRLKSSISTPTTIIILRLH